MRRPSPSIVGVPAGFISSSNASPDASVQQVSSMHDATRLGGCHAGGGTYLEQRQCCLAGEEVRDILPTQRICRQTSTLPCQAHTARHAPDWPWCDTWGTDWGSRRLNTCTRTGLRCTLLRSWRAVRQSTARTYLVNIVGRDDDMTRADAWGGRCGTSCECAALLRSKHVNAWHAATCCVQHACKHAAAVFMCVLEMIVRVRCSHSGS